MSRKKAIVLAYIATTLLSVSIAMAGSLYARYAKGLSLDGTEPTGPIPSWPIEAQLMVYPALVLVGVLFLALTVILLYQMYAEAVAEWRSDR